MEEVKVTNVTMSASSVKDPIYILSSQGTGHYLMNVGSLRSR